MWYSFFKQKAMLREMNYFADQHGIFNRFTREGEGWKTHLSQTKKYITRFLENKSGNLAILGSGWLLDIPLDEINKRFNKVYLIDIVQPPQIKKLVKPYQNIQCLEIDLTGGMVKNAFSFCKNKKQTFDELLKCKPNFEFDFSVDSIISVNLLSQLDTLIVDYMVKKKNLNEKELNTFRKKIQDDHILLLQEKMACLITDYEEWTFDTISNKIQTKQLIYTENLPDKNLVQWDWLFDMTGNYYKGKKTILKVKAVTF